MSAGKEAGQRRRRRVQLTPVRSIPVEFAGSRAGEGPLTLGQLDVYTWTRSNPDHAYVSLYVELPVPAVVPVGDVAEAVAVLIVLHESLRTSYVLGEHPWQRVAASGVQVVEVCSLGEGQWGPGDRPVVAGALVRWLRESPGPARRPVRFAVAVAPGTGEQVIACAVGLTHLAVDHGAIEVLKRDFAGLLGDPARRTAGGAGRAGHQPLDQAELEAAPVERRRAEVALERLGEHFRRMPRCLYAVPGARASGESLAVELSSVAAAMAVRRVAARTRASRSSIVAAAVCAVVARRANYPELEFPVVSSNRFERHLANYVGPLAQNAMATVEIAGRSFDELVYHSSRTVAEASRHARYDAAKRDAMNDLIGRERGLRFNYDPLFNDLVPEPWSGLGAGIEVHPADSEVQPEEIAVALARTELRWHPMPVNGTPVRFILHQVDGCLRLEAWSGDTGLLPRAELESLLLAAERLLVGAAPGDVPAGQLPPLIGLEPIAGSPDRILVDSCWVEVADVQRLVDEATAPAVARVFASIEGRPLVAHLAATDAVHTPGQAHARCVAILAQHPTAITPRHYVICRTAPSDPADPTAWPPPLATGTGRA